MNILEMSLLGSILILLVLLIRGLFVQRLPKRTFPVLWGIVLLRLLIPFSVPLPAALWPAADPEIIRYILPANPSSAVPETPGLPAGAQNPIAPIPSPAAGVSVWVLLWAIGAALVTLYFLLAYVRFRREFHFSAPLENEAAIQWLSAHKLRRRIRFRQSDRIHAPLTYGIFRPVILVPAGMDWDGSPKLSYILTHEWTHIRRFDAVLKFLAAVALCLHWFNPLCWVLYFFLNRDMELSCDEAVLRSFGEKARSAYAYALISMEEQKSGLVPFSSSFSKTPIEERIESIMKYRKKSILTAAACVLLAAGLLTSFITAPDNRKQTASPPSPPKSETTSQGGTSAPVVSPPVSPASVNEPQFVTIDSVELQYYDGGFPYLHDVFSNHTEKAITEYQYCMLAYDKDGKPLKLYWYMMDSSEPPAYANLAVESHPSETEDGPAALLPGGTFDVVGGWSLYDGEVMKDWSKVGDGGPNRVAYALYTVKQLTFSDGSTWDNPDYESWLKTYEGKEVAVTDLQTYYPHNIPVAGAAAENTDADTGINQIRISYKNLVPGGKISLGSQLLTADTQCSVSLTWTGDSKLTVLCTPLNGKGIPFQIESGVQTAFQIDADGEYTLSVKNEGNRVVENISGTIAFGQEMSGRKINQLT